MQWWKEYDFEFDGIPHTYFVFPTDRIIIFDDEIYGLMVPCFEVRQIGRTIETILKENIDFGRTNPDIKDGPIYAHVVRYENRPEIGMFVFSRKLKPKTDFSLENCIEKTKRNLYAQIKETKTENQWGNTVIHSAKEEEQIKSEIEEFTKIIQNRQNLLDETDKYFKNIMENKK